MPTNGRIVDTAMLLRAVAPETWEQFTTAIREFAAASTAELLRCPPEQLPRAQGMAIAANEIALILQNAPRLKEQANAGQRNPTPGH